ncbi:unnamed protein product [Gongylonema pulchrum]|uniref:Uncharacterized protein n=1 Tax=Gongylonema pulchrum TaxID=637853 RepID=A0A183E6Y2_9BILA|nr:unnamed protein product [Gongylonema pulchrum]
MFFKETPCKRSKDGTEMNITTTTSTVVPEGTKPSGARISIKRSMNRSMSESNVLKPNEGVLAEFASNALTPRYGIGASAFDV